MSRPHSSRTTRAKSIGAKRSIVQLSTHDVDSRTSDPKISARSPPGHTHAHIHRQGGRHGCGETWVQPRPTMKGITQPREAQRATLRPREGKAGAHDERKAQKAMRKASKATAMAEAATAPMVLTRESKTAHEVASPSPASRASLQSAECPQCNTIQAAFYCGVCLSERIIFHHANTRRVSEARQKAKEDVQQRLSVGGTVPSKEEHPGAVPVADAERSLPDPFYDAREHAGLCDLDARRKMLGKKAVLEATIQDTYARTLSIRKAIEIGKHNATCAKNSIERRTAALYSAQSIVLGNRHESNLSAASQASVVSKVSLDYTKAQIAGLKRECEQTCGQLAEVRAARAREAAALFSLSAPTGTLASLRTATGTAAQATPGSLHPSPARVRRSRERYMPGGLHFDFAGAFDLSSNQPSREDSSSEGPSHEGPARAIRTTEGATGSVNLNDWSINGLVLPLSGDLQRFERGAINGALEHTVHLLHLVASYLGTTLPFVISCTGGSMSIRPNVLWGSGTKETLYLSSSVYQAIAAKEQSMQSSGALGNMGASVMSTLGASTISTFESFVRLPGSGNFPWSRIQGEALGDERTVREKGSSSRSKKIDDPTALAIKQFGTAYSMLAYDVAYLAFVQGVQIDILTAAGNPLRLLSKALSCSRVGQHSHMTHYQKCNVPHLVFPQLDFAQLSQIHEPGGSYRSSTKQDSKTSPSTSKSKGVSPHKSSTGKSKPSAVELEGSYIDARAAAASILNLRSDVGAQDVSSPQRASSRQDFNSEPRPRSKKTLSQHTPKDFAVKSGANKGISSPASSAKTSPVTHRNDTRSSLAAERMPGALPLNQPSTLEFLRYRGIRAAEESRVSSNVAKTATGAPSTRNAGEQPVPKSPPEGRLGAKAHDSKGSTLTDRPKRSPTQQTNSHIEAAPTRVGGTITFNGKPVQGTLLRDKSRSSGTAGSSEAADDEGWAVL